jgi:hypothetical protein
MPMRTLPGRAGARNCVHSTRGMPNGDDPAICRLSERGEQLLLGILEPAEVRKPRMPKASVSDQCTFFRI